MFQCWIEVQAWPLIIEHWHCQVCDYSSVRVAKNIIEELPYFASRPCRFDDLQLKPPYHYCHILTKIYLKAWIKGSEILQQGHTIILRLIRLEYDLFMEHWSCSALDILKNAVKGEAVNEYWRFTNIMRILHNHATPRTISSTHLVF